MPEFSFKKGLDLPMSGAPVQEIDEGPRIGSVGVIGADTLGLKPGMLVAEGDTVRRGQPLYAHKDTPDVLFTAPATGRVRAINRGARRVLQSVVIDVDDPSDAGEDFGALAEGAGAMTVAEKLCRAGLWPAFRTRPYSHVPDPATRPTAIFVTAMDTEPLAADPAVVIAERPGEFTAGLEAISHLTDGTVWLCKAPDAEVPGGDVEGVEVATFEGPHPAGLAGTHMHFLAPPSGSRVVWTISYQDVIAIGHLMQTGHLDPTRVISLAGPRAVRPRLVRTILGANLTDLTEGEVEGDDPVRVISGSVLTGRMSDDGPFDYLGRYARAVTLITEDREQVLLGWIRPRPDQFAVMPVLASALEKIKRFPMGSNLNGARRASVPLGTFEQLMPQDILPTQLLRALLVMDTDSAQALGALELDEEDLALCTFACPAKYEYGPALRASLTKIEKEG
ncbi:Na(+)-translocating NADH-quinone reductase subunit A [Tropicimonas isoalkanivorans]|uniref:Na(+)-translocating NADH-quinone reductase subunit A n=1 Tax=Tropicimonas isoalkanivorans TaxID=441112 RepID=A0A1I1DPQ0_9RHOB|nr:Na(+)-translocating NADH-quinone reductase subunit A [Tropicimonas isoalkanivorans]SFB76406.1 Na+-transporting NADH:ubiquinone oxidoreductase subunit A [Tropicimonas isoalkanivorans]